VPRESLQDIGFTAEEAQTVKVYRGAGCPTCNNSGYKGRIGLFEVMECTHDLKQLIAAGKTPIEIKNRAIENGMITLRRSGLTKIKNGITSIDEVLAETV